MDELNPTHDIVSLKAALRHAALMAIGDADAAAQLYLDQILRDYDPQEVPHLSAQGLGQLAGNLWRDSQAARDGTRPQLRLHAIDDTPYDAIEIVQPDAPFIVESVMGELVDQGVSVRAMFHPVVSGAAIGEAVGNTADTWSFMLIIVGREDARRHAAISSAIEATLQDLRLAVLDFPRMQKLLAQQIETLEALTDVEAGNMAGAGTLKGSRAAVLAEDIAFLKWINADHFVFLGAKGYTYPRTADGGYAREAPLSPHQEGYGILRDPNRAVLRDSSEPAVLSVQLMDQMAASNPVTVAKANLKSRVHRRAYMDYIGIKRYGPDGQPSGEVRFVGLFTSEAYERPAFDVPLIRHKANLVLEAARARGISDSAYNEKRLRNLIETYPRDELFQILPEDLLRIALGVLHISDRPRVKIFTRTDTFDRFISVLLYLPRELYQVALQQKAGALLAEQYAGRLSACYPQISDQVLSRIHYIIGVTPGHHLDPDIGRLEADIEALTLNWPQKLEAAATEVASGAPQPDGVWAQWGAAFPIGYQERYALTEALADVTRLSQLSETTPFAVRAYRRDENADTVFAFKMYARSDKAIPLSDILPVLEHMGLRAIEEYGYHVRSSAVGSFWVHEFIVELPAGQFDLDAFRDDFEQAVLAVWSGQTESDGFNALILNGLSWREVMLVRALCRYRQQSGLDPSPDIQQTALRDYPEITAALLRLFETRFRPGSDVGARREQAAQIEAEIETLLLKVASLDQDRVLRRLAALIGALTRTNYYQDKPYISFKISSRELKDLPQPKPLREIFVLATHVEGVHLRFGPVSRGGLRWSDRKDDFRTEVLGLVKAQQVKNAVIVPNGSKGGFFPKALPKGGTRDAIQAEAIRAYKTYLCGLLDLTDNLSPEGEVIPPEGLVIWDAADPYLVVAADKGTATFSDTANGVAADYGFWLGDAFASGGSAGYDHKDMGITARGAWEAVKRHFREMDRDIQTQPFTVAGVGDMSGDVFGNGMLRSRQTRLVAAFDHRDIFIDPQPDPETSFVERERLYNLPRSSWADYDKALISQGGGVFSRSLKSIPISPEMKALLDIEAEALTPFDLMQAILKARVDLLWFGGIGTYIKSPLQSHADVGDKANDTIRINGTQVRALVIGEGANLGVTQAGRVNCAETGVRLNTDAIDNSAGVDCSDHEVNIKIALNPLVRKGQMTPEARDALLKDMTDEVATLVLADNYNQTLALTLSQATAAADTEAAQTLMVALEARGLNRQVETLPDAATLDARKAAGRGLYRPELAVVMAYAKIALTEDIVSSDVVDDPALEPLLFDYFPQTMHGHRDAIVGHRLRREILATYLSNEMINTVGPAFAERARRESALEVRGLILGFEAARHLFGLRSLWHRVHELDNRISAEAQIALYQEIAAFTRSQTEWIARRHTGAGQTLSKLTQPYHEGLRALLRVGAAALTEVDRSQLEARQKRFVDMGVPQEMALSIAALNAFHPALDIIDLATASGRDVALTAALYFRTGDLFSFDRLLEGARDLKDGDGWDRLAARRLTEDLVDDHARVVRAMLQSAPSQDVQAIVSQWQQDHDTHLSALARTIDSMTATGAGWSIAKLSLAQARLREWVAQL